MNIGTIIKKYRRNRDMTQEQLAEYLRVSMSAVSQWESGKTAPDLSLIPAICNLFEISADELLGINQEQRTLRIEEIREEASRYNRRGYLVESTEILEKGLREYPDSYALMNDLMYTRFNQYCRDHNATWELDEGIRLANLILEGCMVDDYREGAKQVLCYSYKSKGQLDQALEIACTLPSMYVTEELFMARLQIGTEGYRAHQSFIKNLIDQLDSEMDKNHSLDDGTHAYTGDEMALIQHKRLALYELFIEDGNYGFYHTRLQDIHISLAHHYASRQDHKHTLRHLSAAADHAIAFTKAEGSGDYTCLLLRGYKSDGMTTNASDNNAKAMQSFMVSPIFDFLRDTPDFTAILDRLTPVAGEWRVKGKAYERLAASLHR